jgi:RHS repeat-associated protein
MDSNQNNANPVNLEIVELNSYYPYGMTMEYENNLVSSYANSVARKFKYNGIEHEEAMGLDLYEMDVRHYDAAIARWTGIDPVTHHAMSTYLAFDGNPVFWADPKRATIDLDAHFFSFIENNYSRVIFRNNLRFKQKIAEYLPEVKQQRRYQVETLRMLEEIKNSERFKNFSFCCVDSGFYKIDFIFDDSLITSSRETFNKPINSALKYINKEEIERAKVNFDNIFDNSYQGKDIEFENLKNYISNLFE